MFRTLVGAGLLVGMGLLTMPFGLGPVGSAAADHACIIMPDPEPPVCRACVNDPSGEPIRCYNFGDCHEANRLRCIEDP